MTRIRKYMRLMATYRGKGHDWCYEAFSAPSVKALNDAALRRAQSLFPNADEWTVTEHTTAPKGDA